MQIAQFFARGAGGIGAGQNSPALHGLELVEEPRLIHARRAPFEPARTTRMETYAL